MIDLCTAVAVFCVQRLRAVWCPELCERVELGPQDETKGTETEGIRTIKRDIGKSTHRMKEI